MKIIATLPSSMYFRQINKSNNLDRFTWEDKTSSVVRLVSSHPNPFDRPQVILISQQRMKADNSEYPYRLILKCFEQGEGASDGMILREQFKGVYAWNRRHETWGYPLFFAIPAADKQWLGYSFFYDNLKAQGS